MLGFSPTPSSAKSETLLMQGLAVLLLPLGLLIVWKAARALRRLQKYEFENTTGGGVVQFETFEGSRKHVGKKARAGCALQFGVYLIIFAILIFIAYPLR